MFNANVMFYIFSSLLTFCAVMVIVVKEPVFSLLFLVGSFIFSAFMLLLLECEFLAFLFLFIYIGAVAILFLFAVMMLEAKLPDLSKNVMKSLPIGFFFGVLLLFPLVIEIFSNYHGGAFNDSIYSNQFLYAAKLAEYSSDIEVYGQVLYSHFILQFLVVGLILLAVLMGVVSLVNNYNLQDQRLDQAVFKQLARKSNFFYTI